MSRSIAACEGALLVVDASQGVQAQTISNLYMALEHDLEIIPVMNKCDMDSAMPDEVEDEIIDLLGCKREEIIRASGKTGMGVEEILRALSLPYGRRECTASSLDFRLGIQFVPWYHRLFQGRKRYYPYRRQSEVLQYRKRIRCR